jgi:hypothetical protein
MIAAKIGAKICTRTLSQVDVLGTLDPSDSFHF